MKTAEQVRTETDIAQQMSYIKSKDNIMNYLERQIFQASRRGEYEIKVNLNSLENFVCIPENATFTFKQIINAIFTEMEDNLGYSIDIESLITNVIISWESDTTQKTK